MKRAAILFVVFAIALWLSLWWFAPSQQTYPRNDKPPSDGVMQ